MEQVKFTELYIQNKDKANWRQIKAKKILDEFTSNLNKRFLKQAVAIALNRLVDFAAAHFKKEEELMKRINYPVAKTHILEHEKFLKQIDRLNKRFNNGGQLLPIEVSSFIRDWITNHVMTKDANVGVYLESLANVTEAKTNLKKRSRTRQKGEKKAYAKKEIVEEFSRYYHFSGN